MFLASLVGVAHNTGESFLTATFQANEGMLHNETKSIPVELANMVMIVERHGAPKRRSFTITMEKLQEIENKEVLQIAVRSINDLVRPDGVTQMLLFIAALSRPEVSTEEPTEASFQRAIALQNGIGQTAKHFPVKQVHKALCARNGPDVTKIHTTRIASVVLIYCS